MFYEDTEKAAEMTPADVMWRIDNPEISEQLFISINTVKTHISNIFRKLNVSRRTLIPNCGRDSSSNRGRPVLRPQHAQS